MQDKLADMHEIAAHFGVTTETVRNWIKGRKLPAMKIGGRWRFDWADIERWESPHAVDGESPTAAYYKDYATASSALAANKDYRDPVKSDSYTIVNGDCIDALRAIGNNDIDLLLTDPPYNLGLFMQDRSTNLKQLRGNYFGAAGWDNLTTDDWTESMDAFFEESARVIRTGGALIVFMAVIKLETLIQLAQKHGWDCGQIVGPVEADPGHKRDDLLQLGSLLWSRASQCVKEAPGKQGAKNTALKTPHIYCNKFQAIRTKRLSTLSFRTNRRHSGGQRGSAVTQLLNNPLSFNMR